MTWREVLEKRVARGELASIVSNVVSMGDALARERVDRPSEGVRLDLIGEYFEKKLYCEGMDAAEKYLRLDQQWEPKPGSPIYLTPEGKEFIEKGGYFGKYDKARFLYGVLVKFAKNTSPLGLIELAHESAGSLDALDRVGFYIPLRDVVRGDKAAFWILECLLVESVVNCIMAESGDEKDDILRVCDNRLEKIKSKMDDSPQDAIGLVLCTYYGALAAVGMAQEDWGKEHRNATISLFYTDLNKVPLAKRVEVIVEVCISGLLAPFVFDFGELLTHPCVANYLKKSSKWYFMWQIMVLLQKGDTLSTTTLMEEHKLTELDPRIKKSWSTIAEKIRIIATLSFLFACKQQDKKCVSFLDIQQRCRVEPDQVEPLILRILSLHLLDAKIDGINQTLTIISERPISLDKQQLEILSSRFKQWTTNTKELLDSIQLPPHLLAL